MSDSIDQHAFAQNFYRVDKDRAGKGLIRYSGLAIVIRLFRFMRHVTLFVWQRAGRHGIKNSLVIGARFIRNFNYRDFRRVSSALALPNVRIVAVRHPDNYFKYFGKYLARSFSTESRACILANHYEFLNRRVNQRFLHQVLDGQVQLWMETRGGCAFSIRLGYPRGSEAEGDLYLGFYADSLPLFSMNFTIMPGEMVAAQSEHVVFVGRIQGVKGGFDSIKCATKALGELSPSMLLFSAVRGISNALGITVIVGVGDVDQVCVGGTAGTESKSAYDEFWEAIGARRLGRGMHLFSADMAEKPISMIKSNHRSRVRRRRHHKSVLMHQVEQSFKSVCLN